MELVENGVTYPPNFNEEYRRLQGRHGQREQVGDKTYRVLMVAYGRQQGVLLLHEVSRSIIAYLPQIRCRATVTYSARDVASAQLAYQRLSCRRSLLLNVAKTLAGA